MGGGDKALQPLGRAAMLDHVLARLSGQAGPIIINANGDAERFARFGLPVVPDGVPGFPGPLAGILAGMSWVAARFGEAANLVTVPADCPFLPRDLVVRLSGARDAAGAELALAASGGRLHPVAGLWPVRLAAPLRTALLDEGLRSVERFASRYTRAVAAFATDGVDPFFNVNRPEDLFAAEALVKQAGDTL
jgi:molybdopterin-guanine dinucleotide biosynthesis protein A